MADETSFLGLLSFGDQGWGDELLRGAWLTIQISICSYLVGMVLGLLGAGAKLSHNRILRWIADIYTTIVRAVPELLLIILIYYTGTSALKQLLLMIGIGEGIDVSPFGAAVAALGFIVGAYMTEVFRGAILAVPKGQMEAARAYGMPATLRFRRILFPQLMRYALPGLNNLWLVMIKDSSLISVVGYYELLFAGKQAAASTRDYMFFYAVTALCFLTLTIISMIGSQQLERRSTRGLRRA
ncbi:MAG TPA: ABC transporter permease [Verrucomicrobiae bacterium]|jgi:polar amino acid transport system permease protein|nr:ABC transporter permease [Verrucomicrobiae bacterium]